MTVAIDLRHRLGDFSLDVRFDSAGGLTALFGPSGSGKTSLVNLVGGLMRPDEGTIAVGGQVLVDTGKGVFVPKHRRRLGYVFQDARLFPHLTVRQNLVYGRWFTPREERYQSFDRVVDLLGIAPLLERRPSLLSGGERQRVAIGRALIASPRLLLMDEPLAALDEARKAEILPYIRRLRDEAGIPILYVSHSVAEVLQLASMVVVLSAGRVVAEGDPAATLRRLDLYPMTEEVEAGSIVDTRVERHDEHFGLTHLASAAGTLQVPLLADAIGTPVRLRLRTRDVMIATRRPEGLSALNILSGTIRAITDSGPTSADIRLDCHGTEISARITRQSVAMLDLSVGLPVHAVVKTISFDRGGGERGGPRGEDRDASP
ncbi:molybdenum import ATP-binding protein ModC [Aureimonas sp. SA4125]|uniref:molybdenum ABC transporter ATP-binding protein n=1 Tax=Aureimonas sp. SA4125 TaxID=2826993 RepID=UPI001CC6CB9F|nr:molybdenum ABC transporter ATP-binding protein [Aureimonas sp. SA4125]BDA84126.1 molybdenum import ATP-binding protein ModC [Aureimonas sp. SA4125]